MCMTFSATQVLTGHERKSNYDSNAGEKEWVTSFGPSLPYGRLRGSYIISGYV